MNIRRIFPSRSLSRSGGRSTLPPEHTQGFRDNAAMNAQIQRNIDRETIYILGEISAELQNYIDRPFKCHIVTKEELDKLNGR